MKRYFGLGNAVILSLLACGCIISADPRETKVSLQAGDTLNFAVQVMPASAGIQWYLDGKPLAGETGTSFSYSAVKGDFGYHEISVFENSPFGEDCRIWSVAVSGIGWGTEVIINPDHINIISHYYSLAMSSNGNAFAIWTQPDASWSESIYANMYVAGFGWQETQLIESGMGEAELPKVACDPAGNAIAVWHQRDGIAESIFANRYTAGIGWGTEEPIENRSEWAGSPEIACDAGGNAIAVWSLYDGTVNSIYANRYEALAGWGTEELIEFSDEDVGAPNVASDPVGNAIAVWSQWDGIELNIWANRYVPGMGWGTEELIEFNSGSAYSPKSSFDPHGNAFVVWEQQHGIYANRYDSVSGWDTAQPIALYSGASDYPQIACDPDGNAFVVWRQEVDGIYHIAANRYVDRYGWEAAQLIESSQCNAYLPQIACDVLGNATVVWSQYDEISLSIYSKRYMPGFGWGEAECIESGEGYASGPQVACDVFSNAIAVWRQYDGTTYSLYANRFGLQFP